MSVVQYIKHMSTLKFSFNQVQHTIEVYVQELIVNVDIIIIIDPLLISLYTLGYLEFYFEARGGPEHHPDLLLVFPWKTPFKYRP